MDTITTRINAICDRVAFAERLMRDAATDAKELLLLRDALDTAHRERTSQRLDDGAEIDPRDEERARKILQMPKRA